MDRAPSSKFMRNRPKDRRLTANLHLYWYSLITDGDVPALTAFNPANIPKLWPSCLLAVAEGPASPAMIGDVGPSLRDDCLALRQGLATFEVPAGTLAGRALGCLAGALVCREAVHLEGRFRHLSGEEILYRAIGLPFLDVRGSLTYVLCAANGKKCDPSGKDVP